MPPDENGNIKGISVPRIPWHEDEEPQPIPIPLAQHVIAEWEAEQRKDED